VPETYKLEDLTSRSVSIPPPYTLIKLAHRHVLPGGAMGKEVEGLEDEADAAAPERGPVPVGQ
jgi:hypothetical protein